MPASVEARTQTLGRELFEQTSRYRPGRSELAGDQAMLLLAQSPRFRAHLLRFVDALAGLERDQSGRQVQRLLHEYLDADFPQLPSWLQALLPIVRSEAWPSPLVALVTRAAVRAIAARFIATSGERGVREALSYLRRNGRCPSFDVLGEYVASEQEADASRDRYLTLLQQLGRAPESRRWTPGGVYALQVSLKLSSLTADFNPIDPAGTLRRLRPRLQQIVDTAQRQGIGLTLDMERYETRELTQQIFFEVFEPHGPYGGWNGIGVVLQAYLRDAVAQAEALLAFARRRGTPFQIRLVKGAYWDYETVVAREYGWPSPVWERKVATDLSFEQLSERLIAAVPNIFLAIGSHNLRSHAYAEAVREAQGLPVSTIEHQVLFRTAEGIARALSRMGWSVRDYVPLGELLPGMAYLVRRILENSSQTGFLLHSHTGEPVERLLGQPIPLASAPAALQNGERGRDGTGAGAAFRNNPPLRLFLAEERAAFRAALAAVQQEFGQDYPLELAGETVHTDDITPVYDPSHPQAPPLGQVHNAGPAEVSRALELANGAAADWAARPLSARAGILRRAAELLAQRRLPTAAWMVHEAAKSWSEAIADVDEAIDYLRYYPWQAEALEQAWQAYRPRGVVAVIPPWNFPIAIPCGMTAAALVAGNTVVLKPAEQTPIICRRLVAILHEAGVPDEALIWLPGRGEVTGAALVASPLVDMVAFTGSQAVGTEIFRQGSRVVPRRGGLRATVAEMGGKNAILVFPDADLDEAVVGILTSAFGHANQKCSAASRVLIHAGIYERLRGRLIEGARSLPAGPADEPGSLITPLIDAEARERVRNAATKARAEGHLALDTLTPSASSGGAVLVEIGANRAATAATAQQEIFGPVLALIPFRDEAEAVRIANSTPYALTAGIFSRSPRTIERMVTQLDAGNIYVNRPITGARAGVEPFGGHKLSGTGPKAGGSEYLWAFVTSRAGYRAGGDTQNANGKRLIDQAGSLQPWHATAQRRGQIIQKAWNDFQEQHNSPPLLAASCLLPQALAASPTLPLPGQQTVERWDTPRGCGLVLVDEGAETGNLLELMMAALLAGNGIIVAPDAARRPLVERFLQALHQAGVPASSAQLAAERFDLAATIALPQIRFAAVDMAEEAARTVHRLLAEASATSHAPYLKALISLADGPGLNQPGFLRRFVLPKTVAIRTLHLGADLELIDVAAE